MFKTIKSKKTNCYLLNLGNSYALIDTGTTLDRDFLTNLHAIVPLKKLS